MKLAEDCILSAADGDGGFHIPVEGVRYYFPGYAGWRGIVDAACFPAHDVCCLAQVGRTRSPYP